MILIYANVLLRKQQPEHPQYEQAVAALSSLYNAQQVLIIVPQVLAEFWNVCTRRIENNGFGFFSMCECYRGQSITDDFGSLP